MGKTVGRTGPGALRLRIFFGLVAVLGAGCLVSPAEPDCTVPRTCVECLATSGCGFCDGRCVPGTSLGPDVGSCADYEFEDDLFCPDEPIRPMADCPATTCDACLAASGCVWCEGAFSGGFCSGSGSCSSGHTYASTCPQPCGTYESCGACAADPACEYCWEYRISDRTSTERCTDIYSCSGADGYCTIR